MEFLNGIFEGVGKFFSIVRVTDFIDVILVAYLLYKGIKLVRETRAGQLVKGIVILVLVTILCHWLKFNTISYILRNTMQVGLISLIVVFQPELRRALEKVGRSSIGRFFPNSDTDVEQTIYEIADAAAYMSREKIGALIVCERDTKLGDIINTGTPLNADLTSSLLVNIFIPNTPLHDGAVVVRDGKIKAAACILPLTQNDSLSTELGTRHRAALGVTENSDCAAVVVSEETGKISIAHEGDMTRNLTPESLKKVLTKLLYSDPKSPKEELKNWRDKIKWSKN